MPLAKDTLARQLESVLGSKPASSAQAASDWAAAYTAYAAGALSAAGSLPVTAPANQPLLTAGFLGGFQAQTSAGAAALIAQGVMGFWTAMVWTGATAVGVTVFPGNAALSGALASIFGDAPAKGDDDGARARRLADAFDAGAKAVIVSDVPVVQPAPPIVGAIS
jgi:hypothetical protein